MIEGILRPPTFEELPTLDQLCFRSKASWGYDAAFMARCRPALCVDRTLASAGLVQVAMHAREIMGVAQVSLRRTAGDVRVAELDLMFVDPPAHGLGLGRALMGWAVEVARERQAHRLEILSDPGAKGFYLRCGAVLVGDAPSDVVPGRRLPLLHVEL
ncbi:MAG: GNAT family N-acetyltransferase [Bradymonadia bacterium]